MNSQFWIGVVEDRADPLMIGRCRVRVFGVHTPNTFKLPSDDLPWATPIGPINSAAMTGIGQTHVGPVEGSLVVGFFMDYPDTQMPAFLGTIAGVPQDPTRTLELIAFDFNNTDPLNKTSSDVDQLILSGEKSNLEPNYIMKPDILPLERKSENFFGANSGYQYSFSLEGYELLQKLNTEDVGSFYGAVTQVNNRDWNAAQKEMGSPILTTYFLSEGLPKVDGSTSTPKDPVPPRPVTTPLFITDPLTTVDIDVGFNDPNGIYPDPVYIGEPDTHRLARHQNIRRTIVYQKEMDLKSDIPIALSEEQTWKYPPVPYNAKYPFNKVTASETGHIIEIDDTPNCERINIHHRSGSFIEIDSSGTQVNRIRGNGYEIVEKNGFVDIYGECVVNIGGNASISVEGEARIEVQEDVTVKSHKNINLIAEQDLTMSMDSLIVNARGGISFDVGSGFDMKTVNSVNVDGSEIWLNSGKSSVSQIAEIEELEYELDPLQVMTRLDEEATFVELPEEDDMAEAHRQNLVVKGLVRPNDLEDDERSSTSAKAGQTSSKTNKEVETTGNNIGTTRLSKHFNLAQLTASSTVKDSMHPVRAQHGLSVEDLIHNLGMIATNCLDVIWEKEQFRITSGLRWANNPWSKSNTISRHELGLAVDLQFASLSRNQLVDLCHWISKNVPYDTLLLEYTPGYRSVWLHVQLEGSGTKGGRSGNRGRHMTAVQTGNKTVFKSYSEFQAYGA